MAKKKRKESEPETPAETSSEAGEQVIAWLSQKRRSLYGGVAVIVVVAGTIWFMRAASVRREAFAESALNQARVAVQTGNVALAANDLDRVVNQSAGTKAGQEAMLLLAKVRILQGNPEIAVSELRTFLSGGPDAEFRAPAANLLGNALEELGQFGEAAAAYEQAAESSPYQLIKAQFLMDAGRTAALAGDTERAVAAYQRVVDENEDEPLAQEARLRLAEVQPPGTGA